MKLALHIAWRFLSSAKKQTIIIILGISVGVSVQVFIGSLISGLQKSLVDATIGSASHISILAEDDEYLSDYLNEIDRLSNFSNEIQVISPVLDRGGILQKGLLEKEILLRGFDLSLANQIYGFDKKITDESELPLSLNEVILGIQLKTDLNLSVGDTITINSRGIFKELKIVGFFDFNVAIINQTWGIATLGTLQDLIGDTTSITSIEMQIKEVFSAQALALELNQEIASRNLKTINWMDQNQQLLSGLQGQSTSSLMIQVFVIISVVLGISSVLAITVLQKSKQIGILKAMGITDRDASLVFLFEGFILGIFGAIGGILLGLGLSLSFTTFALNPDGTPVVPLNVEINFIILSGAIALIASTLAALTPAIKSSKLTVIEVIRNA
jgi:lipoprotein-releasing system permease protein